MPTLGLSWLERWILCWLRADAQRSQGLLATSAQRLFADFAPQEQQLMRASLARLETKGLIVVGRAPGKNPMYLSLTAAGAQCVPQVPRRFHR
jgi:DNA-binding transcriptional regulator PaaX